ncbi:MAG: stage III sporulation protein AD [Alistipes sp.]|nr:stage III sporulation protein AD [Alistipes sp.]
MIVVRIALIGITGVIFANYFKSVKNEYGMLIGLFVTILIFYYIVEKLSGLMDVIEETGMFFEEHMDFLGVLIKMLGISYICELSAGVCKDAGYNAIASQIVIFGKITIMTLGSSILFSLIKTIHIYLG